MSTELTPNDVRFFHSYAHSTITLDLSDLGTQTDADGTSFKVITDGSHWYIIGGVVFGGEDAIGTGFELTTTTDVDD